MERIYRCFGVVLFVLTLAVWGAMPARAQFGIKKPELPKIGGGSGNSNSGSSNQESSTQAEGERGRDERNEGANDLPALVYDAPFPPSILYSTLLVNDGIMFHQDGKFYPNQVTAVFLPEKDAEGNAVSYGIGENEHRLMSILYNQSGEEVKRMDWLAPAVAVFGQKGALRTISTYNHNGTLETQLGAGSYRLDFFLDGKRFYSFPFTVSVISKGDPYDPKPLYGIDGPWEDYGYIYIPDARPDRSVDWKMWLRNDDPDIVIREKDVDVSLTLKRDGAVVGKTRGSTQYSIHRRWNRHEFPLYKADGTEQRLMGSDLFDNPGRYELAVNISGEKRVYKFEVKEGKIVHAGRQNREGVDPIRYIEGGRDAWWLRREGAEYD